MYAACPACKTTYLVSATQLRAASGQVRCGNCQNVFDVTCAVFDEPEQALAYAEQRLREVSEEIDDLVERALDEVSATDTPPDVLTEGDAGSEGMTDQPVSSQQDSEVADLVGIAIGTVNVHLPADVDTYAAPVKAEFVFGAPLQEQPEIEMPSAVLLFEPGPVGARTSWGAIAAALFLTLLLMGQYIWAERYRLAGIPAFRPYLETACATLGCDLPLRHETARLEVLEREIRNHPHVDDALLVSATFVNSADFAQSYPVFEVAFSDVSGMPVAVRRFLPDEYLNGVDSSTGMVSGQQTRLMLEIVDPGGRAVSFQFDFL